MLLVGLLVFEYIKNLALATALKMKDPKKSGDENPTSSSGNRNNGPEEGDDDMELELSSLRCSSVQIEMSSDNRRRAYPGLAMGSVFSSGSLMKFSIIANELHNIQNVQLRRVYLSLLSSFTGVSAWNSVHRTSLIFTISQLFVCHSQLMAGI